MKSFKHYINNKSVVVGVVCCLIILSGLISMVTLASMKEEPVQKEKKIEPLAIEVQTIEFRDYPTSIIGYGTVVCRDLADISSEISGKIVWVNPESEAGQWVKAGDVLFKIDSADHRLRYRRAMAEEKEIRQNIQNLSFQYDFEKERLADLDRNETLALSQFKRVKSLFETDNVVSQYDLEKAEMDLNSARLSKKELKKQLILYPGQIQIENFRLEASKTKLEQNRLNIERCEIKAPFSGRIKTSLVETGMHVEQATPLVTLCDDSTLEIQVSITAGDLDILTNSSDPEEISGAECTISWIDIGTPYRLKGSVDRIIKYNESTRTLLCAVSIRPETLKDNKTSFSIMEGMFCEVRINGKPLTQVVKLPYKALLDQTNVYKVAHNQLQRATVTVARQIGNTIFVNSGLVQGDQVVVSHVPEADETRQIRIINQDVIHE